ncbi:MAG: hypothetical protein EOQ93_03095 [Mesorhizobium sp.]|nr:MAG: hypothetical protein EOQ93_03095 [Mesorhizobium sp.]
MAVLFWGDYNSGMFFPTKAYFYSPEKPGPNSVNVSDNELLYLELKARNEAGEVKQIAIQGFDNEVYLDKSLSKEAIGQRIDEIKAADDAARETKRQEHHIAILKSGAIAAVVPPTVLLILGLAVSWVAAGFRAKRSS